MPAIPPGGVPSADRPAADEGKWRKVKPPRRAAARQEAAPGCPAANRGGEPGRAGVDPRVHAQAGMYFMYLGEVSLSSGRISPFSTERLMSLEIVDWAPLPSPNLSRRVPLVM